MVKVTASYRDIWHIAYPIMLGSAAQTVLGLTDTAFLGRVGEVELGASAIAGVFYFVLVMLGTAIAIGTQILIARKAGEGKSNEIGIIHDNSLLIFLSLSLILLFIIYYFSPLLFAYILQSENIASAATDFILYRGWGIFFAMIQNSFRGFFVGIATTRVITYSSFLMTGLNVILAYGLIFGNLGMPKMGIAGAGLASAISEMVAAIYLVLFTCLKKEFKIYGLFRFKKPDAATINTILNLSSPILIQNLLSMGSWFLFFVFIEHLGQRQIAVSNIVRSAYMILITPMWGISAAANTMVSNLIGQEKHNDIFLLLKRIITLSVCISFALGLIYVLFPRQILGIITSDIVLINESLGSFYVICGAIYVFCISIVLFSAVSGTGNTKIAMMIEFFNILVYIVFIYVCVFVLDTSVIWVWTSEILYWLLMGIFSLIYLRTGHWRKIKL